MLARTYSIFINSTIERKAFMEAFGKKVVQLRFVILAVALLLLIPSIIGYNSTRINYDVLTYLPDSIDTIKGPNSLALNLHIASGIPRSSHSTPATSSMHSAATTAQPPGKIV